MMSPGISPGAPPSGFARDKTGWLPPSGAQNGTANCVPYPRKRTKPPPAPIEPFPDLDWYSELEEAKSRPVGQFAGIIPQVVNRKGLECVIVPVRQGADADSVCSADLQVQWRDGREYLADCKPGTRFPVCTYLSFS